MSRKVAIAGFGQYGWVNLDLITPLVAYDSCSI